MNPAEFEQLSSHEERLWWFRGMREIFNLLLDRYCPAGPGAQLLEAGCGTGFEAARLRRERGWAVTPIDLSPVAAAHARVRGLNPALAGIEALPFASQTFQGVISLDVLVHLDVAGQRRAIIEFARVLQPGGWILVRSAALEVLRSRHSEWVGERHRVRLPELRYAAEAAGLQVRYATYANSLLLPVALAKFRVWEPLAGGPAASGVAMPAQWLNRLLELPLRVERGWLAMGGRFPVGQSVYVVAVKPA